MRFEEALTCYHDEIFRYLHRLCQSAGLKDADSEAEDLTQDTFERAYRAYDRLQPNSNVRAWLYAIAGNCARDYHTRQQRATRYLSSQEPQHSRFANPERELQQGQQRQWLLQAISQLPFKQKNALILRHLQELDYQDIGRILSCSPASARANVYQALKQLRAAEIIQEDQE